jgi:formylmethanofuran dehydrogenase subunit E
MDTERLLSWMNDPYRKPANLAFTAGAERQVAYWMEMAMNEVVKNDETRLNEKNVALFVKKFRDLGLKDRSASADVVEVLNEALVSTQDEVFDIAKTICEILEPERLGGIVSLNCSLCHEMFDVQELMDKMDTCSQCRIIGPGGL